MSQPRYLLRAFGERRAVFLLAVLFAFVDRFVVVFLVVFRAVAISMAPGGRELLSVSPLTPWRGKTLFITRLANQVARPFHPRMNS
jgi:hypothetical protein